MPARLRNSLEGSQSSVIYNEECPVSSMDINDVSSQINKSICGNICKLYFGFADKNITSSRYFANFCLSKVNISINTGDVNYQIHLNSDNLTYIDDTDPVDSTLPYIMCNTDFNSNKYYLCIGKRTVTYSDTMYKYGIRSNSGINGTVSVVSVQTLNNLNSNLGTPTSYREVTEFTLSNSSNFTLQELNQAFNWHDSMIIELDKNLFSTVYQNYSQCNTTLLYAKKSNIFDFQLNKTNTANFGSSNFSESYALNPISENDDNCELELPAFITLQCPDNTDVAYLSPLRLPNGVSVSVTVYNKIFKGQTLVLLKNKSDKYYLIPKDQYLQIGKSSLDVVISSKSDSIDSIGHTSESVTTVDFMNACDNIVKFATDFGFTEINFNLTESYSFTNYSVSDLKSVDLSQFTKISFNGESISSGNTTSSVTSLFTLNGVLNSNSITEINLNNFNYGGNGSLPLIKVTKSPVNTLINLNNSKVTNLEGSSIIGNNVILTLNNCNYSSIDMCNFSCKEVHLNNCSNFGLRQESYWNMNTLKSVKNCDKIRFNNRIYFASDCIIENSTIEIISGGESFSFNARNSTILLNSQSIGTVNFSGELNNCYINGNNTESRINICKSLNSIFKDISNLKICNAYGNDTKNSHNYSIRNCDFINCKVELENNTYLTEFKNCRILKIPN